jgi:hypothetical protein
MGGATREVHVEDGLRPAPRLAAPRPGWRRSGWARMIAAAAKLDKSAPEREAPSRRLRCDPLLGTLRPWQLDPPQLPNFGPAGPYDSL